MAELDRKLIRKTNETEPVRLNKYLSDAGFCSRREADRLIEAGRVYVDGCPAVMGQKVAPGQTVKVDSAEVKPTDALIILAYNKPAGVECTTSAAVKNNIIEAVDHPERVYPIGRLDRNSTGLILLTNTGELVNSILRSVNRHEKEYVVTVDRPVNDEFIRKMSEGVLLKYVPTRRGSEDIVTKKCKVRKISDHVFSITLTQGINRQIRRMCKALGYNVTALHRVRIMNIELGSLPEGKYRSISEEEVKELIAELSESGR